MIKIGMCDDCIDSLNSIIKFIEAELIEQDIEAEITLISDNQKEIFDAIYNKEIDILFLDIDFKNGGKNGIDFAKDLREINRKFYLVFLSSYQRYMSISFAVIVFDYLVKPINREIIQEIIARFKNEFTNNQNNFLSLNKWVSIRTDDIFYIEKNGNKAKIVTSYSEEETTKSLNSLLDILPSCFKKCHRSYIINEDRILSINKKENYAILPKGICCPINSHFNI